MFRPLGMVAPAGCFVKEEEEQLPTGRRAPSVLTGEGVPMRCRTGLPAFAFLLLAAGPGLAADEAADNKLALRTAAALYDDVRISELPNGLRIYLKPINALTAVTTLVAYKVGSADEDK